MKLRQFLPVLGVIALVAVIYSPSSLGVTATAGGAGDGGTGPYDTSGSGTSMFFSYLRSAGYHVVIANTSNEVQNQFSSGATKAFFLIGPDLALSTPETIAVEQGYYAGRVSLLVAEGNTTNNDFVSSSVGASVSGAVISDPISPFNDHRVFTISLSLNGTRTGGVMDIASPITLYPNSTLRPAAVTSAESFDSGNGTAGPRTAMAAGTRSVGSSEFPYVDHAVLLTDSAPFTNFLFNYTSPGVNEKAFVASMVSYVVPLKNTTIVLDNAHYAGPKPPKFSVGLPIRPLVTYALEQDLSTMNSYYNTFPSSVSGFLSGFGIPISPGAATAIVAGILLLSVYGAVTRWFAPEKRGKDDQPIPGVERTIVAESSARTGFLQTSRSKGVYLATLAQLYDLLDSTMLAEFGAGLASIDEGQLAMKVGADEARRAVELFLKLRKFRDYASGDRRFLFPPVLRWRALTSRLTNDAESFLNSLGRTIYGNEVRRDQRPELAAIERVRA